MSTPSTSSEEDSRSGAPVKSRKRPKLCCNLCGVEDIPDFEAHQPQLEFQDLRAHYFCLLFSSGLGQSGEEHEGLKGFMPPDVRKELKRGARLKCVYCKLKGATVGCAKQECKKSYHLPCGMKHGSLQQYFDQVLFPPMISFVKVLAMAIWGTIYTIIVLSILVQKLLPTASADAKSR